MSMAKSVNKKSFYGGMESGKTPDIAMPAYDERPAIQESAPNPWDNQQPSQATQQVFSVPDELPQEVAQELEQQKDSEHEPEKVVEKNIEAKPGPQDSFRSLREKAEKAERERDALLAQMLEMQKRTNVAEPKQETEIQEDFDWDISDSDLLEGKHAKKIIKEMRKLKTEISQYQKQSSQTAIEAKIKAVYPDFEKVVSAENVERLNYEYPEVAQSLKDNPDIYSKAAAAYSIIKRFGIHQEDPIQTYEKQKATQNLSKPRPLASVSPQQGDSPLSKANAFANGLTEDLKAQLRKEMFASRKSI